MTSTALGVQTHTLQRLSTIYSGWVLLGRRVLIVVANLGLTSRVKEQGRIYKPGRNWLQKNIIYPSPHSRRDVEDAALAPHAPVGAEPLFPVNLRPDAWEIPATPGCTPWRFRVPDGRTIEFIDENVGLVKRIAGVDFGDFIIWRRDNLAAYELAVVVDDHHMRIGEVVRGKDLLTSTARQLLLYEALGWKPPQFFHTNLIVGPDSKRLAKRTKGLMIRELRRKGFSPETVLSGSVEGTFWK